MDGIYRDYSACPICGGKHGTACRGAIFQTGDVKMDKEEQAYWRIRKEFCHVKTLGVAADVDSAMCNVDNLVAIYKAEIATLKAEVERKDEALSEIMINLSPPRRDFTGAAYYIAEKALTKQET